MDPILIALITTVGAIAAAWVGARTKRWVDQKNAEAAEAAAELERYRLDRESWQVLVEQWRSDVRELRAMRAEDKRVYDAEIRECRVRIEQLERDRELDRDRIRRMTEDLSALALWARAVVQLLQTHNIDFPELPIDLEDI